MSPRALRLDSIHSKILAFGVLATLIPSLTIAWISYVQNKQALEDKLHRELESASSQAARELDLWAKERLYDLRVFASSYEVSENLERLERGRAGEAALRRLTEYLNSVHERYGAYERLTVVDPASRVVASSGTRAGAFQLPPDWVSALRAGEAVVGDVERDSAGGQPLMVLAVPIRLADGRLLGGLAAQLDLDALGEILRRFSPADAGEMHLITPEGGLIVGSRSGAVDPATARLAPAAAGDLLAAEGRVSEYRDLDGRTVVGTLRRVPRLGWAVVADIPADEAFRQVTRLRNVTVLVVAALFAGIGLIAYLLGLVIVRPLNRLTTAAAKVAAGDLSVDLAVTTRGEVGYLTEVFNDMVARLREGRQELERLSVTDALTGLYNRRHLLETLGNEIRRSRRLNHSCTLLMADVDHFKNYNDRFGHLAGDDVLTRVAAMLRESTREVDCVARYGGEEFVVLQPETALDEAASVAERIRARVAQEEFNGGSITVSIGVAQFPADGETPEGLIAAADGALYEAKRGGRNRVVRTSL